MVDEVLSTEDINRRGTHEGEVKQRPFGDANLKSPTKGANRVSPDPPEVHGVGRWRAAVYVGAHDSLPDFLASTGARALKSTFLFCDGAASCYSVVIFRPYP